MRRTGSLLHRCSCLVLVFSLLSAGCISKDRPGTDGGWRGDEDVHRRGTVDPYGTGDWVPDGEVGGAPEEEGGFFGPLLPYPLGTVSFEDEPGFVVAGWTGIIVGGAAGAVVATFVIVLAAMGGEGGGRGTGSFFEGMIVCGAVAGGLLVTLPIRGVQALWGLCFGESEGGEPDYDAACPWVDPARP